jgi:hypothetical protein
MYLSNHKRAYPLRKLIRTNYFITFIALMAVNPFFNTVTNVYLLIFLLYLLFIAKTRNIKVYNRKIGTAVIFVYILIFLQAFIYGGFSYAAIYFPLILIYVPFLLYSILGLSLLKYFLNIIFYISIITFPIWLLQSLIHPFDMWLQQAIEWVYPYSWSSVPRSLLFYTAAWADTIFNAKIGIYRNSGLFHEPGAYGVFLILGIVVNILLNGKFLDRKNIVFLVCLLTTLSTAAFVGLFFIIAFYLFELKISVFFQAILFLVLLFSSYQVYQNTEFLGEKINSQYEDQTYTAENKLGKYDAQSGRFYAFFTSLNLFLDHPIFGRGIIYASSEKASGEMNTGGSYSYGLTGIFSNYGIIGGLYFLVFMFKGFKRMNLRNYSSFFLLMIFIVVNLSLQTQIFITTIFFVFIFILGLTSPPTNAIKRK